MPDMQRENLFRSAPAFEMRDDGDGREGGMPTMVINFARFDEWTEIRSLFEGHFMERFARGAFRKTIKEQGDRIRSLFQHGRDPQIGMKPLGPITDIREKQDGGWAEVQLLDTDYVRELIPGLESGLYGASFQFKPIRQEIVEKPERSDANPDGIPEVTITEAKLREVGPVMFGQYENASAAVRSLTDDLVLEQLAREHPDRLRALLEERDQRTSSDSHDEERAPGNVSTPVLEVARRRLLLMQRRLPAGLNG